MIHGEPRGLLAVGLLGLALACTLACSGAAGDGCDFHGRHYQRGQIFPAGDHCNQCTCSERGVECSALFCDDAGPGADAAVEACTPSGGCASGRACAGLCCGVGERCAGDACQCGSRGACDPGDTCQAAGPVGQDGCGQICCGASGPCPQ